MKLLHPAFGRAHRYLFLIAYLLYLLDTFLVQTLVQLAMLCALLLLMFAWEPVVQGGKRRKWAALRILQITTVLQLLATYAVSVPLVGQLLQDRYGTVFTLLGVVGLEEHLDATRTYRCHFIVLSFAVFASEAYFVAQRVDD